MKGSWHASRPALVSGHLRFRHHPALPVLCGLSMALIDQLKLLGSRKAADRPSTAAPTAAAADEDDLPIPSDINAVFLGGLFLLSMLAARRQTMLIPDALHASPKPPPTGTASAARIIDHEPGRPSPAWGPYAVR